MAINISMLTRPLARQWLEAWGLAAIRSEEYAFIRDIRELAQCGNPDALAVVEQTIQTITIDRIKS